MNKKSLLKIISPKSNMTILIYDVHASESGALSILNDLYNQIVDYPDKTIKWIFSVSTPQYKEYENIKVLRFPWVKKNWIFRSFFDMITTRKILKKYNPDIVFSLQNKGINYYKKTQYVYLHLPFILTNHKFRIKTDGVRLWIYQNILSKMIFKSYKNVNKVIVQTQWMKDALIKKGNIEENKIIINEPDISSNNIINWIDNKQNRLRFFYPATSFFYKNHITLLKAINYISEHGIKNYEVFLTIKKDENKYTEKLYNYVDKNKLNVIFNGKISREEVFERYSNSVLLFPSYVESFGLPLLEARMSNTYIIASDCPFSREILEGYQKAYFFDEEDYKKMGEIILNIIREK